MAIFLGNNQVGVVVAGKEGDDKILKEEYVINPTREDSGNPDTIQYDIYTEPFYDAEGNEYDGAGNIKVRKVGSWIDSEISADNIRKGKSILGVAGNIIELVPDTTVVKSTSHQQVITPRGDANGFTEVIVEPYNTEYKTVSPTQSYIYVRPSEGYDALTEVTVRPVTSDIDINIQPENIKKDITILGVTGTFEEGEVDPILQELIIAPTTEEQIITPSEGVDGFSKVNINAVTSSIDANITPRNIKRGVNILGVEGNYVIENLQDKVANPTTSTQVITFDDGYEGLGNVTITPVTSTIDTNIVAENIREGVTILGVTGTLEDDVVEIEPTRTVVPQTNAQIITPNEGYDALSQVNIEGVTASIDPNILAENIKKNIEILGVKGTLESQSYNLQDSKEVEPSTYDMEITPDTTYDALLKVIVKAVTASIDPNILPKNIKKNISILGVVGTLEEGEAQKWFDFEGLQGYAPLGKIPNGTGGNDSINMTLTTNNYVAEEFINKNFDNVSNISAALFNIVTGYDDADVTYNVLEQPFVAFIGGKYYSDYSSMITIEDQIRYLYPLENELGVNGCTINYEDNGSATTLNAYVIIDSSGVNKPTPVLVNGNLSLNMLPDGFDSIRYVSEMHVPEHTVFNPKIDQSFVTHWLKDEGVNYVINEHNDKPLTVDISAWDVDNGKDEEITVSSQVSYNDSLNKIGSPNISSDYVISGFSGSNYYQLKNRFNPSPKTWEVVLKFRLNNSGYEQGLMGYMGAGYFRLHVNSSNRIGLAVATVNNAWNIGEAFGTTSLSTNTDYWVKAEFTGTAYNFYISTNGIDYNLEGTINSTTSAVFPTVTTLGVVLNNDWYLRGSIDLKESYAKANNEYVWKPATKIDFLTTNHNINPLTRDLMFYPKSQSIGSEELTYPFEAKLIDLSTLVDGNNFIINSASQGIASGPSSYQVNSGISRGYIRHKSGNKTGRLDVTCYTSSEAGYDFGGVYVGKKQWNPSRSDLQNNYNDGTGSWIYRSMGNTSVVNCSATLEPNTEYYITFMYTKDGSGNSGEDRFVIQKIAIDGIEISAGDLINYEDDGSAVEMPLYYSSFGSGSKSFTQPTLSSNGTMGGSSFATTADHETNGNNPAWYAFDGNDNTYWRGGNVPGYIDFYNPKAMVVKNIRWGYFYSYPTAGNVQGSNNGSIWENIIDWTNGSSSDFDIDLSSNTTAYKYYRINVSSVNMDVIHCKQLTITGEINAVESVYVFSPDDSFVDGENYTNATLVDVISIPEHNADFILDSSTGKFIASKTITINVEDENTTIYTKIED